MQYISSSTICCVPWEHNWSIPVYQLQNESPRVISLRLLAREKFQDDVHMPSSEEQVLDEILASSLWSFTSSLHISDISLASSVWKIRTYYETLWYFKEELNTYEVDIHGTPITFGAHIEHVLYAINDKNHVSPVVPLRSSWDRKALLAGINSGIITGLHGCTNTTIQILLESEMISPYMLGQISCYNFQKQWLEWLEQRICF